MKPDRGRSLHGRSRLDDSFFFLIPDPPSSSSCVNKAFIVAVSLSLLVIITNTARRKEGDIPLRLAAQSYGLRPLRECQDRRRRMRRRGQISRGRCLSSAASPTMRTAVFSATARRRPVRHESSHWGGLSANSLKKKIKENG